MNHMKDRSPYLNEKKGESFKLDGCISKMYDDEELRYISRKILKDDMV